MKPTNFDKYLREQLKNGQFAKRFAHAGEAWDVSLQITALRKQAGLSQQQLASRLGTSQQQISRLESPDYEGHSLSMLRRVATELNAEVQITIKAGKNRRQNMIAETRADYKQHTSFPRRRESS